MRKIVFILSMLFTHFMVHSQNDSRKALYGFQLMNVHNDFGMGLHVLTPELISQSRISVRANVHWLEHLHTSVEETWTPYFNTHVGFRYCHPIGQRTQVYSEGGFVFLLPNKTLSDRGLTLGGFGLFGFEFFLSEGASRNPSYFFEFGGIGTGAVAGKVLTRPIYSNGFLVSVGMRF